MPGLVCVDASFVLKIPVAEAGAAAARAQWTAWRGNGVAIVAPWLWLFEAHSTLRRKVRRRELTGDEGEEAWRILRRLGIRTVNPRGVFERAWTLALELDRATTYDTVYLATAELRGCELWTADARLYNAAVDRFGWIRLVRGRPA